jgi:hypothetical protein
MVTYYLGFLIFVIHWDNPDNCKVWTKSLMVMFGASCRPITLWIHLGWASERQNALDICDVKMIIVLCFSIILGAMKFLGMGIVYNFRYPSSVSWNPQSIPLAVSYVILPPPIYKLVVLKCIMLFTSFQIFQKSWSTWAPMPIRL